MHRLLKYLPLLLLIAVPSGISGQQDLTRPQATASYTIEASLDPETRRLTGKARILWRNTTPAPATELRLHMYWNAWRNDDSTWMRERRLSGDRSLEGRPESMRGRTDLTMLQLADAAGPVDLLPKATYIAPDDANDRDRTLLAVPLDQPVMPGHDVTVDLTWTAQVPVTYERTGVSGDYFFLGQWFPKVGVLDADGWQARQFHAHAEFYADFGRYDVSLRVPQGWIVGATGMEVSRSDHPDGTATHRHVAEDVHDFAWTTSPRFQERTTQYVEAGRPAVTIRLLLQPEHVSQAERHFDAARATLKYYGGWLAPYPWPQLTIVDPVTIVNARVQGGSSGAMEYPTLVTAGTRWLVPWSEAEPESVVMHEVGHQFWHSIVATNETEHGWMDEGINTFTTARLIDDTFPNRFVAVERYFGGLVAWPYEDVRWTRLGNGLYLHDYRPMPGWDAPAIPTWRQSPRTSMATNYGRVPLALETLERLLGRDTVRTILSTHFARGAFRHPTPDEFFAIASGISNRDLSWFFDAMHRSGAAFDYAVGDVTTTRTGSDTYETTVTLRRLAEGVFPVDVLVSFEDGSSVMERWDGRNQWHTLRFEGQSPASTVGVDPHRVLVLDTHYTNNTWTSRPANGKAADKWALRWLAWFQHVLLTYAFFA